jgi:hypothetical protein
VKHRMYGHRKGWKKRLRVGVENKSAQQRVKEGPPPHRCMDEVAGFCAVCADYLAEKEAK